MIELINIDRIIPHPNNPRKDLGDLDELTASVAANGIFQNLTVVEHDIVEQDENWQNDAAPTRRKGYMCVIGHRRLAAAKTAGLTEVPCAVVVMDEKTQLATMLLENMLRTDLSFYEQAQGMQMMLDLGETVGGLADKTGFSESTVRRRVKLLELDKEKFEEAAERGGNLEDYAALDKLEKPANKNLVLESIGTSDFSWRLRSAIESEELDEMHTALLDKLSESDWAQKLDELPENAEKDDFVLVQRVVRSKYAYKNFEPPEGFDTGEIEYYYIDRESHIDIYANAEQLTDAEAEPEPDPAEIERERRIAELEKLAERAYKNRMEFAKTVKGNRKDSDAIERIAGTVLAGGIGMIEREEFADFIGVDPGDLPWHIQDREADKRETFREARERVMNHSNMKPLELLFVAAYLRLESRGHTYHKSDGTPRNSDNFNMLGYLLSSVGYKYSSEEKELCNGTHELFVKGDADRD